MAENKRFKVIETITHDDRRVYELTKNDIGYYNFKGEKLLANMICNELNGLIEKNKVLCKEIKRLKTQNNDLLFSNAKNMELLEKENKELKSELQKIYDVATINKAREIVDGIYDELLYETSEESEHKREIIFRCLEKLDDFRDDVE